MTVACQPPLSMGISRQEYLSGLPFPSPANLPDPGIEPASSALAGGLFTTEPPGKLSYHFYFISYYISHQCLLYFFSIHCHNPLRYSSSRTWESSLEFPSLTIFKQISLSLIVLNVLFSNEFYWP